MQESRPEGRLPKLSHPIRTGEHNNTAFSMGLMLDYARIAGHTDFGKLVESRARESGADAFLRKPLAERRLVETVRELLAVKRTPREGEEGRT